MVYLHAKLTRLGQPVDAVLVSADLEIPRAVLKRRGAISLEEPSDVIRVARESYAHRAKRLRLASPVALALEQNAAASPPLPPPPSPGPAGSRPPSSSAYF